MPSFFWFSFKRLLCGGLGFCLGFRMVCCLDVGFVGTGHVGLREGLGNRRFDRWLLGCRLLVLLVCSIDDCSFTRAFRGTLG